MKKILKSSYKFFISRMPGKIKLKYLYKRYYGVSANFKNPKTFSEKIQVRKLHYKPIYAKLSDKYGVRKYLQEIGHQDLLIDLLGVYDKISIRDLERIDAPYIVKTSHSGEKGVGDVKIVYSKPSRSDLEVIAKDFNKHVRRKYINARARHETHYNKIEPKIIIERLLLDDNAVPNDYKFHCFNNSSGFHFILQFDDGRYSRNPYKTFFDMNLKPIAVSEDNAPYDITSRITDPNIKKMIELAKELSAPFDYVRVDLYSVGDTVYFGEFTFTPASGFFNYTPSKYDIEFGKLYDIKF